MSTDLVYLIAWSILALNLSACRITPAATSSPVTSTSATVPLPATLTPTALPQPVTPTPIASPPAATLPPTPTFSQPLSATSTLTNLPLGLNSLLPLNDPTGKLSVSLALLANPPTPNLETQPLSQSLDLFESSIDGLVRNQQGEILVYIRLANVPGTSVDDLKDAGATITHEAAGYGIVTAFIAPKRLTDLAQLDVVQSVQEVLSP